MRFAAESVFFYSIVTRDRLANSGQFPTKKTDSKEKKGLYIERKNMKKHSRIFLQVLCSGCMAFGSVTSSLMPVFAIEETDPGALSEVPVAVPNLTKLTLTVDLEGESWGSGNGADKAIDGDMGTIFDGLKNTTVKEPGRIFIPFRKSPLRTKLPKYALLRLMKAFLHPIATSNITKMNEERTPMQIM